MPITGSTQGKSYARLHVMRLGATRLDYYQPWFKVLVNGVDKTSKIRIANASITQNLDGIPDTAALRVSGFTPTKGQEIKIYMGDTDTAHCLFAGHILSVKTIYEGDLATNVAYDLGCIDYTWRLNDKKVLKKYTSSSATTIVTDLISTYASGFTTTHVATGLATLDEITFTNEDVTDALDRIKARIGGYWYLDYGKDLHFFTTDDSGAAQSVTDASPKTWDGIAQDVDLSQVRTRAIVRGGGSNASSDVAVGTTTLPVTDGSWYSSGGGYVECGPQRITYTSKSTLDGQGSVTGGVPGSAPTAPSVTQAAPYVTGNLAQTTGFEVYRYKVTFVSALGESSASSAATGSIAKIANAGGVTAAGTTGGSLSATGTYYYAVTFVTASGEVGYSVANPSGWSPGGANTALSLTTIAVSTDARVTSRKLYRTTNGGITFKLVTTIADNVTTTYTDTTADGSLGATMPTTDTGSTGKLTAGIPLGPVGTTSRKLYRTVLNGSSYLLQSTTADNTTTSVLDNTADGSLGAALGTSTIGASPGDTTLSVTDLSLFHDGGWVRVGSQLLLYTARAASSGAGNLTGIPASGVGAITAIIPAGTTVVVEPHLTGIASSGAGSIVYAINSGDQVNVRVERNDATAQSNLAGFLGTGDGIVEEFLSDGRLSIAEAQNRGDAALSDHKDPLTTVTGTTRDQTVRPGRTVTFTVTNPPISGTLKIQRVTITEIAIAGGTTNYTFPKRQVDATSKRFSLEDLLRQVRNATAA